MSTVTEQQTVHEDANVAPEPAGNDTVAATKPGDMSKAEAQAVMDGHSSIGVESIDGNAEPGKTPVSSTADPTPDPVEEETTEKATETTTELTPRLQKALDSVKGSEAVREALAGDPAALERIAKQREAIARANGRLGAYTRETNKKAAAEKVPEPEKEVAKVVEPEPVAEMDNDTFMDEGHTAVNLLRKENADLRKEFGSLKERIDAQDNKAREQEEIHQTTVFDDFIETLDPKVYPQYGEGPGALLAVDDPAYGVRLELWKKYLDAIEGAKGTQVTDVESLENAFFHIHREPPTLRTVKATAKKPTATVRPTGNPPVRTSEQAATADARRVLGAFGKGEPIT